MSQVYNESENRPEKLCFIFFYNGRRLPDKKTTTEWSMVDIWLRASGKLAICSATVVQLSARYESEAAAAAAAPRAFS